MLQDPRPFMAFATTSSASGTCPTLFVTKRKTLVIQGTTVTDPLALAIMRARGNGIPSYESAVEVPAELLPFVDVAALEQLAFAREDRPVFLVDPAAAGNAAALAATITRS
ncbi:hypothetical protein NQK81_13200 [Amycolatopsis roodepoortensis]|uniref:hypothetical protein n=1 Tax=Amycolatopsis roodepoortensis TaxID=700274 RepID=UPI00214C2776|nr:hypothetical protein [Amycolatopsis roodepoortensis]UUV34361.1 hypothetical protein NQK81_13200 [Amycolatopsis roodepoortensis]